MLTVLSPPATRLYKSATDWLAGWRYSLVLLCQQKHSMECHLDYISDTCVSVLFT